MPICFVRHGILTSACKVVTFRPASQDVLVEIVLLIVGSLQAILVACGRGLFSRVPLTRRECQASAFTVFCEVICAIHPRDYIDVWFGNRAIWLSRSTNGLRGNV